MYSENDDLSNHPDLVGSAWADRIARIEKQHSRRQRWSGRNRQVRKWLPLGAVLVVVLGGWIAFNHPNFGGTVAVRSSSTPTTTSTRRAPETARVNLNMPFLNTPAAGWADGADGFVAPVAAAVGGYDAGTVASAYERTRQLLITQRVDRAAITSNDTGRVLSQLAPKMREFAEGELRDKPDSTTGFYVTAIAPGQVLLPAQPKVFGSMQAQLNEEGELAIHTNYVVAYAFDPGDPQRVRQAMDMIVVQRWEVDYTFANATDAAGRRWVEGTQGIWLRKAQGHTYSGECTWGNKGFLAPSFAKAQSMGGAPPEHNADYYFDPTHPIPTGDNCH
ncbi:hypothetical protein [Nocardia sp. NPDC004722]